MAAAALRREALLVLRAWLEDGAEVPLRVRLTEIGDAGVLVSYVATVEEAERIVRQRLTELLARDETEGP